MSESASPTRFTVDVELDEQTLARVERLAALRGESLEDVVRWVALSGARRVPGNIKDTDRSLEDLEFTEVGISPEGDPFIHLTNGRIFYGHFANPRNMNMYYLMRDRTPREFDPTTYSLGIEARRLYGAGTKSPYFPTTGVVVEAGAYVGFRAIGYLDRLDADGTVVAIELAPENYRLLERNVQENGLEDRIRLFNVGVWNKATTIELRGTGRMQHTIADTDQLQYPAMGSARTETLDDIFDASNIDFVDFLNIQVNGAELEALDGLQRWFDRVKVFRIAAYYNKDGAHIAGLVAEVLKSRGCEIVKQSPKGSMTALGPAYKSLER